MRGCSASLVVVVDGGRIGRFVVLERIDRTTKLQRISLAGATNILGSAWDDAATSPSLEQTAAEDR